MGVPAMGHAAKAGTGATGAAVTEAFEFRSEGIARRATHVETEGIRGTRSHISENVSQGIYTVGGPLVLVPTPDVLDVFLPRILGAAESIDSFALAETLPDFVLQIDRVTKVFAYSGCVVNRATFRSSKGQNLILEMDIQGKKEGSYATTTFTETTLGNAGTFPSLTIPSDAPFMHHHAAVTLVGAGSREVDNVEITIDNALILDRFNNSQTRTALPSGDRIVSFSCDNPYSSDEVALYNQAIAGSAAIVAYANGTNTLTFTFATIQFPAMSPVVVGKGEIPLRLEGIARMSGSTRELVVTSTNA